MAERAKIFNLGDLCKFLHLDTSQTARFMTSTLQRVPSVFRAAGLGGVVCVCYPPRRRMLSLPAYFGLDYLFCNRRRQHSPPG